MAHSIPASKVIKLDEEIVQRVRTQYQRFQEESAISDKQFDSSNDIEYYILSTKFIQQWKAMAQPILQHSAPTKPNVEIRSPDPMNLELVQDHLLDFNEYELKKEIQQGKDFKFYNASTMSIFSSYQGARIPRRAYYSGVEKKVEMHPIRFQFIYVSRFWLANLKQNPTIELPVLQSLGYKNQTILDLQYRLVQFSKKDARNKNALYINNAAARIYLALDFNAKQYASKLVNAQNNENLQPPGTEINSSKMIGELQIPNQKFTLIVQLQEDKWLYKQISNEKERCEFCRSVKALKFECKCKEVKYCSESCKEKDWKYHVRSCESMNQQQNTNPQFKMKEGSRNGFVGLANLGNTCYMNAALQCMLHTRDLTSYFRQLKYIDEVNENNPIGSKGKLVKSYAKFIEAALTTEEQVVTPSRLKYAIGKVKDMFSGFEQHDSQQFLLFMLDTLHEDLNRVLQKPLTAGVENQGRPDDVVAKESWITYLKRNQSIINDLMGGQYRSQVKCPDCNNISVTFDPYLIFAVPIPSNEAKSINLYYFCSNFNSDTLKMTVTSKNNQVKQLKDDVAKKSKTPLEQIVFVVSGFNGSVRIVDDSQTVDKLTNQKQLNQNSEQRQLFAMQFQVEQLKDLQNKKFLIFKFVTKDGKTLTFKKPFPMIIKGLNGLKLYDRICQYTLNLWAKSQRKLQDKERQTKLKVFRTKIDQQKLFKIYLSYGKPVQIRNKLSFQQKMEIQPNTDLQKLLIQNNFEVQFEVQYTSDPCYGFNTYKTYYPEGKSHSYDSEDLMKNGNDQKYTLQECLAQMKKSQKLLQGNQVFCSKCQDLKLAQKKMQLYKASKYLVIQLRRFKQVGYEKSKNYAEVDFPVNLDLAQYILSPTVPQTYFIHDEEFFIKPKYWKGYDKSISTKYKLYGVVNHHGSLAGGHYTAFAQHNEKWYKFDDSDVTPVETEKIVTSAAYILFYEKQQ